ncbi:hypothetical protein F5Y03DRAFT_360955 [Xylaria venustula]|nr:hypothetical protein F5Y03DRAFT_360955 [Xylaria venustula]
MTQAPPRKQRLEIPLSSKPRDYRPGDGPALAPVRLSLEHDTDAFIVDKQVLPGQPVNGDLKLELYYIVSWPNLPKARVAVLATKILDYVSPRALEDWEYERSLERDEEDQRRVAAEKARQEERDRAHAASITPGTGVSTPLTSGQKRRGRPSKAEMVARRLAQQASFGADELANVPLPPTATSGPSLSTPKKRRLPQVSMDLDELEDPDMNEAISKQRQADSVRDSDSPMAGDMDEPGQLDTGNGFTALDSFPPGPSSRGYAESSVPNLPSSTQNDLSRSISPVPISLYHNSKEASSRSKTQLTTPVPVSTYPRQTRKRKLSVPQEKTITPVPTPWYPPPRVKEKHIVANTAIPTPKCPVPKPKLTQRRHEVTVTPVPLPVVNPTQKPKISLPHKVSYTPVPAPVLPKAPEKTSIVANIPGHPPSSSTSDEAVGLCKQNGFTPAGRNHKKRPADFGEEAEVGAVSNDSPHAPSKSSTSTTKTTSSRKKKPPQPIQEQEWEVKQLEDDSYVEIDGKLVRLFQVRWKGNWPADQNPTWEPEENIPPALVRKYFKDQAAKEARGSSASKKVERPIPPLKRKYSSVAEAFEGDADYPPGPSNGHSGGLRGEEGIERDDYAEEELLQVTEQTRNNTPFQRPRVDPALVMELIASFL